MSDQRDGGTPLPDGRTCRDCEHADHCLSHGLTTPEARVCSVGETTFKVARAWYEARIRELEAVPVRILARAWKTEAGLEDELGNLHDATPMCADCGETGATHEAIVHADDCVIGIAAGALRGAR